MEVFDCDITPAGQAYIVMELLEGETLASLLEMAGNLTADLGAVVSIGSQIASALAAAHDKGIVHRDLKPDNVFLTADSARSDGTLVKIVDFGIAKLLDTTADRSSTQTGNIMGTPQFMAPEQCRGIAEIDHRVDVYALGCILMAMTTGAPPFVRQALGDLMVAHISEPPPSLSDRVPSVPPALDLLVAECLSKNPAHRPRDMRLVEERLREIGSRLPAPLTRPRDLSSRWRGQMTGGSGTMPLAAEPPVPEMLQPLGRSSAISVDIVSTPGGTRPLPVATSPSRRFGTTLGEGAVAMERPYGRRSAFDWAKVAIPAALALAGVSGAWLLYGRPWSASRNVHSVGLSSATSPGTVGRRSDDGEPTTKPSEARPIRKAEAADTVSIQLRGLPVGAVLRVDGEPADAPFELARDQREHKVVIRAPGYQDEFLTVHGARDQRLVVVMRTMPTVTPAPSRGHRERKKSASSSHSPSPSDHHGADFRGFSDL